MGKRKATEKGEKEDQQSRARNIKNVYIDKISNLIRHSREKLNEQDQQILVTYKLKRYSKTENESFNQDKLERNREAARVARKRKNIYLSLLERQIISLQHSLKEAKRKQKQSKALLNSLNSSQVRSKRSAEDPIQKFILHELFEQEDSDLNKTIRRMNSTTDELRSTYVSTDILEIIDNVASHDTKLCQRFDTMTKTINHLRNRYEEFQKHLSGLPIINNQMIYYLSRCSSQPPTESQQPPTESQQPRTEQGQHLKEKFLANLDSQSLNFYQRLQLYTEGQEGQSMKKEVRPGSAQQIPLASIVKGIVDLDAYVSKLSQDFEAKTDMT